MSAKRAKKKAGPKAGLILFALGLAVVLCLGLLIALVSLDVFGKLPSKAELAAIQHEEATLVLARDGTIIGKLFAEDRTNIRYEDIPILVDDMIDTGGTLAKAADLMIKRGALQFVLTRYYRGMPTKKLKTQN